jgi:hypothetical protein
VLPLLLLLLLPLLLLTRLLQPRCCWQCLLSEVLQLQRRTTEALAQQGRLPLVHLAAH